MRLPDAGVACTACRARRSRHAVKGFKDMMRPLHFLLLCGVCAVWGLNFVVTKWIIVGDGDVAGYLGMGPIFAVAVRFSIAALLLSPLLRPLPRDLPAVLLLGLVFGAAHFGLMHLGLLTATSSSAAITIQLVAPFTTVLSVLLLGEKVGPPRVIGVTLAFLGVVLIAFDPHSTRFSLGVLLVAAAAGCGAWGSILVKQLEPIGALRMQAWMMLVSAPVLLILSALFETGQVEGLMSGDWRLVAAMAFVVGGVTLFAHTAYMWLLRRYEASFITPMTLMAPIWGVTFGVTLMDDPMSARFFVGAAIALLGVGIVAVRTGRRAASVSATPTELVTPPERP
jgi:O-acetylserine/cysteine efflux transporter